MEQELPTGWLELSARATPLPTGRCLHCGQPPIVNTFDGYRCAAHPPVTDEFTVPVLPELRKGDSVSRGPDGNIRLMRTVDRDNVEVKPIGLAKRDGWGLNINWASA
jgi:hypothetical protein